MPNTTLINTVRSIITEVPELHMQTVFGATKDFEGNEALLYQAQAHAAAHPELPIPPECNTAHCVAGWGMIASGYDYLRGMFYRPGDHLSIGQYYEDFTHCPEIMEAAALFGIEPDEAYHYFHSRNLGGIFNEEINLTQILVWMDYFCGDMDEAAQEDRDNALLEAAE